MAFKSTFFLQTSGKSPFLDGKHCLKQVLFKYGLATTTLWTADTLGDRQGQLFVITPAAQILFVVHRQVQSLLSV